MSNTSNCPECAASVTVPADAVEGEVVGCSSCSTELEVLATTPLQLAPAPELAEDWGE